MRKRILTGLTICICVGCAQPPTVQLVGKAKVPVAQVSSKKELLSGAVISKIAVADGDSGIFWNPDGSLTKISEFDKVVKESAFGDADGKLFRGKAFVVMVQSKTDPTIVVQDSQRRALRSSARFTLRVGKSTSWLHATKADFAKVKSMDIFLGVASSSWKTVGAYSQLKGRIQHTSGSEFKFLVFYKQIGDHPIITIAADVPKTAFDRDFRYVIKDREGTALRTGGSFTPDQDSVFAEYEFLGKQSDVGTIELQARDFEWQKYSDVQLNPKQ